jgi:hypothetical protein
MCWRLACRCLIGAVLICDGVLGQELPRVQAPDETGIGQSRPAPKAQERIEPAIEGQQVPETRQDPGAEQGEPRGGQQEADAKRLISSLNAIEASIRDLIAEEDALVRMRQEQREIADLQAQKDMAFWAGRMFWATAATVGLTFVSLVLIGFTLRYTRSAALYAKTAAEAAVASVDEARKGTAAAAQAANAATEANQLQWQTLIVSERAWLKITHVRITSPMKWVE